MSDPLVSILIPCHNAAPWLAACLESALAQTWRSKEIILVDDGSTDGSLEIAAPFLERGVIILAQQNRGQSAALNTAIRAAKGEYYEFLDADDLLAPDKIAQQIQRLLKCEPGCVASGAWARFSHSVEEANFLAEEVWQDLDPISWLAISWSGGGMMHGAAWLIPSKVVQQAGYWAEDLSLVNDFDFFSRVLLQSQGVKFCRDAKSYYRSGLAGSLSGEKSLAAWQSAFASFTRGTDRLLAAEDSPRTRRAAARTFQSFAYSAYPTAGDLVRQAEERVKQLGGSDLKLRSGRLFNLLCDTLGWRAARRAQAWWSSRRRVFKTSPAGHP